MASGWAWTFFFFLSIQSIGASQFIVGGSKGWGIPSGSESYNQWAGKNRFQIGDTLLFKYDQNVDSVLQVSSENYKTCNTTIPIKSFQDGNTIFKFDHHGAFYFISGNSSNCKKGEQLIVVVMAPCHNGEVRNCGQSLSPSSSPSPSTTPTISPSPRSSPSTSPSPSPKTSPSSSPSPSPKSSPSPKTSPSPSPSPKTSPSPSPSPKTSPSLSPSSSPSTSHAPTPTPISYPSLSPPPSISLSPSSSPPSPEIITPSSSSNTSPGPAPVRSASSSSATSLVNLVIPLLLVGLLKPNL